jgi:hypothetical protein
MTEIQNTKDKTVVLNCFEICNLKIICNLVLGICYLRRQAPKQVLLSLPYPEARIPMSVKP